MWQACVVCGAWSHGGHHHHEHHHLLAQVVKLVDAGARGDSYFVEYTVQKMPEAKKHLYSQLALGYNGRCVQACVCALVCMRNRQPCMCRRLQSLGVVSFAHCRAVKPRRCSNRWFA